MANFSDLFPDAALLSALGDDITYISQSGITPQQIKAVVDLNVQIGEYVSETQHEIEFLTELLNDEPAENDVVVHGLDTYTLKTRLTNDGQYQRWSVKNA